MQVDGEVPSDTLPTKTNAQEREANNPCVFVDIRKRGCNVSHLRPSPLIRAATHAPLGLVRLQPVRTTASCRVVDSQMASPYALGRKRGTNKHFRAAAFEPKALHLPDAVSYEYDAPDVFNQLSFGTCVGNASAAVYEFYAKKRGVALSPVSRRAIYSQAKHAFEPNDIADDGLMVTDGLLVLEKFGSVAESAWPYPADGDEASLLEPVPADLWNATFEASAWLSVDTSSADAMMRALSEHGPMIVGMEWAAENFGAPPNGLLDPALAKTDAGGHCVWILAYDQHRFGGAFKIRNSWSAAWGCQGDGWLPFSALSTTFAPDEAYCLAFAAAK